VSHDDYEFGPHHPIHVGRHYIGGWSYGRKRKGTGTPVSAHGKPMWVACGIIGVILAADILGDTLGNLAEVAVITLGGIAATAAIAARARFRRPAAALAPVSRQAIAGDRLALEQQLRETQAALAAVVTAAHQAEPARRVPTSAGPGQESAYVR
jgi:hypothetical protein